MYKHWYEGKIWDEVINSEIAKLFGEQKIKEALTLIRDQWRKHADMEFLRKFSLVHWGTIEDIRYLLLNPDPTRDIASEGYLVPPYIGGRGWIGCVIEGDIVLAGNGDLLSSQWEFKDGKRYTSSVNQLFTNEATYDSTVSFHEFVLSNWHTRKIIVNTEDPQYDPNIDFLQNASLPIIDQYGQPLILQI